MNWLIPNNTVIKYELTLKNGFFMIEQTHCSNLITLDISNCKFSSDFLMLHIEEFQRGCPRLEILRLAGCMVRASQASNKIQVVIFPLQYLYENDAVILTTTLCSLHATPARRPSNLIVPKKSSFLTWGINKWMWLFPLIYLKFNDIRKRGCPCKQPILGRYTTSCIQGYKTQDGYLMNNVFTSQSRWYSTFHLDSSLYYTQSHYLMHSVVYVDLRKSNSAFKIKDKISSSKLIFIFL